MPYYNFDEIIDRTGTDSLKYDFAAERGRPGGLISMWVADMDFRVPEGVTAAIKNVVEHGIYGYTEAKGNYFAAVSAWFRSRFGYATEPEWLVKTPGIVYSLAAAVRAFTEKGDAVLIQQPVYYPFSEVILVNERKLISSDLVLENGRYVIDFDDFERKITQNSVKLFLLCSPHNPVGRVWTRGELTKLGEICVKHGVIVVSDEIHCDFTYSGHTHTVFASISPDFAQNSVIATAPSKTFNLAGLQISNIFIANPELRAQFRREIDRTGYSQLNTIGLAACRAAYETGGEWLDALKLHLADNLAFQREFVAERLPRLTLIDPEGTYLTWLDCRGLGLGRDELENFILNRAKLWLDGGHIFGDTGAGFERFNIACARSTLAAAMERLENAVNEI
ncbi:MAG: pyridoxal phosphate-dependent aminotransferase [Oscillospiraceae bacterium]|jgi:cystathionine beta-lyase|nr:pyridoxal phosphate-dependent aminotransferase [Oscillospiraceae bacterium]